MSLSSTRSRWVAHIQRVYQQDHSSSAALYLGWRMVVEDNHGLLRLPLPPAPPKPRELDSLSPQLEALDQFLRPWQGYRKSNSRQ